MEQPPLIETALQISPNSKQTIIITVTGSRSIKDWVFAYECLNDFKNKYIPSGFPLLFRSGHAVGFDRLAENWCKNFNIPVQIFLPDWEKHGRAAGIKRNLEMLDGASGVIGVWDGKSKGALHCFTEAQKRKIFTRVYQIQKTI